MLRWNVTVYFYFLFFIVCNVGLKICENPQFADTLCHHIVVNGDLPCADEEQFLPDSVFFIETSCLGGLNPRQACSVESAARANPERDIIVLFTGPVVNKQCLQTKTLDMLRQYSNIKLFRIHMPFYSKGTPLEYWLSDAVWRLVIASSTVPVLQTSDVLRFLTLYKFSGIYLDLDVITVRPFDWLPMTNNWIGKESDTRLGTSLLALSNNRFGREIAFRLMYLITRSITHDGWDYTGYDVLTKVLYDICISVNKTIWSAETCRGFEVYPKEYFYPIPYLNFSDLFTYAPEPEINPSAFAYHLWNDVTKDLEIIRDSLYGHLVRNYCPKISKMFDTSKTVLSKLKPKTNLDRFISKIKEEYYEEAINKMEENKPSTISTNPMEKELIGIQDLVNVVFTKTYIRDNIYYS